MGNVPSKEPQGRSFHKLSKPRNASYAIPTPTTTSAPTPAATVTSERATSDGQLSPSRSTVPQGLVTDLISIPYSATASSGSLADGDDDHDANRLSAGRKPLRRLSLFRSRSSQEPSGRRKSRRNTILGSPVAPAPSEHFEDLAIGRANSVSTPVASEAYSALPSLQSRPSLGPRPTSWAYNLSSYEAQRVLNLVQESPPPLPRSQTTRNPLGQSGFEGNQTRAWRRASIAGLPESAPISRSHSEVSLHPPMRRRSLVQTPGVATRTAPGPINPRSRRSSLRHSHPPTPSMSRQSSFEIRENHFLSLPPLYAPPRLDGQAPSLLTPQDTDYSTTGAFKFGTLRITNGSPVSTPKMATVSEGKVQKSESLGSMGDYFAPAPRGLGLTGATDRAPIPSCVQTAISQLPDVQPASSRPILDPVDKPAPPTLSISLVPDVKSGRQYASELQSSPIELLDSSELPPASPLLQTQSKHAAVDDDLFEDDDQPEISAIEVLDVRIDLNAKGLPPPPADSTQIVARGVLRSDSGFVSNSKSTSSQSATSLAKADSGYSSNVSLRSLRNGKDSTKKGRGADRGSTESDGELPKVQGGGVPKVLHSQLPSGDDCTAEGSQSDSPPTPPPKDNFLASQSLGNKAGAGSEQAMLAEKVVRKPVKQQPPAIDISHAVESGLKTPESVPPTPASVKSDGTASSLSIGNSSQRPGRLQRFLSLRHSPFSKQSYTVHATHDVDSQIPAIPKEVEDKLREHTGLFPMTNKRLALKSQMSKETLKTILSVGSLEFAKDEDDLAPTTAVFDEDEDEDADEDADFDSGDAQEKSLFGSMQSGLKNAAASMMSNRKSTARKPVPMRRGSQNQDPESIAIEDGMLPAEAQITSYSLVNSSLGRSAYDAAAAATKSSSHPDRSTSMTPGRDYPLQRRTYSLDGTPSSSPNRGRASLTSNSREGKRPEDRTSSPPISMKTRGAVRVPPPRSQLSPKGPAVPRENSQNHALAPVRGLSTPPSNRRASHRTSLDAALQAQMTLERSFPLNNSGPSSRHETLGSQRLPAADSRHSSILSTRSDFSRESRSLQFHSHSINGPALKHQSSLESFSRAQLPGVRGPQPSHHGSASGPPVQFDVSSKYWNSQIISRPVDGGLHSSGQLAWAPPYVPRGHHRRNLSAGSRPPQHTSGAHAPYRILHSYNSPAYRNAPIWG